MADATQTALGNAAVTAAGNTASSGLGLLGGLGDSGISLYEYLQTQNQIKQLEAQPYPEESVSPELQNAYSQALNLSKEGYTPEEKTAFQANENRAANTQYANAVKLGGDQLGNAIQGSLNSNEIMSYDSFAAKDADLHRQNITNLETQAGNIQEEKNHIQDERIDHRNKMEDALGDAAKAQLGNIYKAIPGIAGVLGGTLKSGIEAGQAYSAYKDYKDNIDQQQSGITATQDNQPYATQSIF